MPIMKQVVFYAGFEYNYDTNKIELFDENGNIIDTFDVNRLVTNHIDQINKNSPFEFILIGEN